MCTCALSARWSFERQDRPTCNRIWFERFVIVKFGTKIEQAVDHRECAKCLQADTLSMQGVFQSCLRPGLSRAPLSHPLADIASGNFIKDHDPKMIRWCHSLITVVFVSKVMGLTETQEGVIAKESKDEGEESEESEEEQ